MFTKFMKIPEGLSRNMFAGFFVVLMALGLGAGQSMAMNWCGDNGTIRFSFVEGDSTTNIHHQEMENGVTMVTIVAWLADVDPVSLDGAPFHDVGGFELQLLITGAQGFILNHKTVNQGLNMSPDEGCFMAGLSEGLSVKNGYAPLARWEIMFQGEVKDVRFGLNPDGLYSCRTTPNCSDSEPLAIYIGTEKGNQLIELFGAGYEPAWLNPTTDPDVTLVTGKTTWKDAGRAQKIVEK